MRYPPQGFPVSTGISNIGTSTQAVAGHTESVGPTLVDDGGEDIISTTLDLANEPAGAGSAHKAILILHITLAAWAGAGTITITDTTGGVFMVPNGTTDVYSAVIGAYGAAFVASAIASDGATSAQVTVAQEQWAADWTLPVPTVNNAQIVGWEWGDQSATPLFIFSAIPAGIVGPACAIAVMIQPSLWVNFDPLTFIEGVLYPISPALGNYSGQQVIGTFVNFPSVMVYDTVIGTPGGTIPVPGNQSWTVATS